MSNEEQEKQTILLELRGVKKDYFIGKKSFTALHEINLCLPKTGFVAILGPSGSGKTTMLNILGGLDHFQEGDLLIEGISTKDFTSADWDTYRNKYVGFVFQSYNLVATYSLEKNISLPLSLRGVKRKERLEKARDALRKVGLEEDMKKRPTELSGGQQQRVAIARALVNDPSLILCDEPTGALDSKTSVVAMDLLKKLSADRLVVMVTHNEVLAKKYADRIVVVEDGEISSDSNPLPSKNEPPRQREKKEKTRMPLLSAFGTSATNIFLKKGRNIITAIACSIGVIGVALVLGAANGFRNYVNNVEQSVGSSVPITISPMSYNSQANNRDAYNTSNEFPDDNKIHVYDTSRSTYVAHQNKFTKEYLDYLNDILENPECPAYSTAMSILKNRNYLDFHFLTENGDTGNIISINASQNAGTLGSMLSSYASIPGSIIHELYGDENLLDRYYHVISGRMPEAADELVLVVDRYNRVEFSTLIKLGILSETDYSTLPEEKRKIDFADILYSGPGDTKYKEYKCYRNSDYYDIEHPNVLEFDQWTDIELKGAEGGSIDFSNLHFEGKHDPDNKKKCTIYPIPEDINAFYYEDHNAFSCKIVGVLRPTEESYLTLMPASLAYRTELKEAMVTDYETKSKCMADAQKSNWFVPYSYKDDGAGNMIPRSDDGLENMNNALKDIAASYAGGNIDSSTNVSTSSALLLNGAIRYIDAKAAASRDGVVTSLSYTSSNSLFLRWNYMYGGDFHTVSVNSLEDLIGYYLTNDFFSTDGNKTIVDVLAYMNAFSLITSISIFPSSLSAKVPLKAYLDAWNEGKEDADTIIYSDLVGEVTDTIGTLITVISGALIIFASVSLVVSSVMTSVISYVSVIERKKEIGVLRSCGARKKDVGRLFESENAILGFLSGALGIIIAFVASFPINAIVNDIYPQANLRNIITITPLHILLLLGLAVFLALISGFIPSRMAANKDPVECLRSE